MGSITYADTFRDKESLRIVANNTPFGVFRIDETGRIFDVNETFLNIIQKSRDDVMGKTVDSLNGMFPKTWDDVRVHLDHMQHGYAGDLFTEVELPCGTTKYVRIVYQPILNGKFLGSVGMVYDQTKKREILTKLYEIRGGQHHG